MRVFTCWRSSACRIAVASSEGDAASPAASEPLLSIWRNIYVHGLAQTVSASAVLHDAFRDHAADQLKFMGAEAGAAEEVSACFAAGGDLSRCVERAVALKVASPFDAYAAELDREIAAGRLRFSYTRPLNAWPEAPPRPP